MSLSALWFYSFYLRDKNLKASGLGGSDGHWISRTLASPTKHNRAGKRLCDTQKQADTQVLDQASPSLGDLINETIDPRELEFP